MPHPHLLAQGEWYLEADLTLHCFDGTWAVFALLSGLLVCVFTVGLPLGIIMWLRRYRNRLREPATIQAVGFLYAVYGEQAYFWEVGCVLSTCVRQRVLD